MITKLILYLCKFNFINSFVKKLMDSYQKKISTQKENKTPEEICRENLLQISEYERKGPASGLPVPKIYPIPGKGA
jgi:hypothetical protein